MGGGAWTKDAFADYSCSVGRTVDHHGHVIGNYSAQQMFKSSSLAPELDPKDVVRECCDTEEHPETKPVILALDVTGSMGGASVEIAKKLNVIMTELYKRVKGVEFLIMGIGDLECDFAPVQASQFESDIRIAKQLDKIYFEGHGGMNDYESYTAAWYFWLHQTKLDCWKRSKKGVIITIGDETLNDHLPSDKMERHLGELHQYGSDVDTSTLYKYASEKFDIYHLAVDDKETSYSIFKNDIEETFGKYLDDKHLITVNMNNIANAIIGIVVATFEDSTQTVATNSGDGISW